MAQVEHPKIRKALSVLSIALGAAILLFGIQDDLIGKLSRYQWKIQFDGKKSVGKFTGQSSLGQSQLIKEHFVWSEGIGDWVIRRFGERENVDSKSGQGCVWPEDVCSGRLGELNDRIVNQLKLNQSSERVVRIHFAQDFSIRSSVFLENGCLVNRCRITFDANQADAIVFRNADVFKEPPEELRARQIWVAYLLESPPNTFDRRFERQYRGRHLFNWTASYRSNSDIVTPYSKFVPFEDQLNEHLALKSVGWPRGNLREDYVRPPIKSNKQSRVAWFVSNCDADNDRLEFALELSKHIQVDIYGKCGNLTCYKWDQSNCLKLLNREYKFYLSFENSNNAEYITEKLFRNALGYNDPDHLLLPIVMGPSRRDYELIAPPASFIHVDDFKSASELAKYLRLLDSDDALYFSYFRWKTVGKFIDTKFACRLCAMLHETIRSGRSKTYSSIRKWWLNDASG